MVRSASCNVAFRSMAFSQAHQPRSRQWRPYRTWTGARTPGSTGARRHRPPARGQSVVGLALLREERKSGLDALAGVLRLGEIQFREDGVDVLLHGPLREYERVGN